MTQLENESLAERLKPRVAVEEYFARSGRTFRKGRFRLWFEHHVQVHLIKFVLKALGIYARGRRNALSPILRHLVLSYPGLPADFDGFRILQLSDLHIDKIDGLAEALARVLDPVRADICVLTGDYRFEISGSCEPVYPRLRTVLEAVDAPYGTFGILGNHDAAEIAAGLDDMGVQMLLNDSFEIQRGSTSVYLAGVDDPFDYRCDDLPKALSNVPERAFKILLAHTPALYRAASDRGVQLYLCGHTHAGQIRVPLIGAIKKNVSLPRRFVQDHWTHQSMHGYTSWGAGCSTLPVRYNCPPEVALIELRTA